MEQQQLQQQQFSLSWREFQGNLSSGCSHLLASGDFADVTLAIEGRLLKAHRLVLSICSPFFQRMFHANPCQHPIVVLKDISYTAMRDLLQFMYNGEVSVRQEDLTALISTAETLEVKGLTNKISNQENNNDIPSTPPKSHKITSHNSPTRREDTPEKVANNFAQSINRSPGRPIEFFDHLNKMASLKRKSDILSPANPHQDNHNHVQPEKRVKLREKLILNRHKIAKVPNKIVPKITSPFNDVVSKNDHSITASEQMQHMMEKLIANRNANHVREPIVPMENGHGDHDHRDSISIPDDDTIEEIKKETDEAEVEEKICEDLSANDKSSPETEATSLVVGNHVQPTLVARNEPDGGAANDCERPVTTWPVPDSKGGAFLPFAEHRIVTIPQKEDGKKKYPQKSCRYCWRAGRRRDTRFMCEQCRVPLCKLVCFEKHQAALDSFVKDESFNLSIVN